MDKMIEGSRICLYIAASVLALSIAWDILTNITGDNTTQCKCGSNCPCMVEDK